MVMSAKNSRRHGPRIGAGVMEAVVVMVDYLLLSRRKSRILICGVFLDDLCSIVD
jgi:hypothetical protein